MAVAILHREPVIVFIEAGVWTDRIHPEGVTMRFSYAMLADYPLTDSLSSIRKADELGFYAVYAPDETWHKDLWLLFAAAAAQTSQIRMGPSVSGVVLREPTLIAQAAATLDELTNGRAEEIGRASCRERV